MSGINFAGDEYIIQKHESLKNQSLVYTCSCPFTLKKMTANTAVAFNPQQNIVNQVLWSVFKVRRLVMFQFPTSLPYLAHQLAIQNPRAIPALAEKIRVNPDCSTHPLNKQFNELLSNLLKTLSHSRHTVLLVLDALDEWSSKEGTSNILELLLAHASTISSSLRILITSRPKTRILSVFSKARNHAKIVLHDIEKPVVNNDIVRFVRHGLQVIFARNDMPNDADLNRLFIFASISLRYIDDEFAGDPETRLKVILGEKMVYKSRPYTGLDSTGRF